MSLLRPRDIQAMYGITVGSWRHAQKTMDLEPVFLRAGAKPMYRAEVILRKFGKPKREEVSRKGAEAQRF